MESQEFYEQSKLNVAAYRFISYGLVSLMMSCAVATVVSLVNEIIPSFRPFYLVVLCFIVSLDRLYGYRISRNWMFLSREWLSFFGTHAIVLVALAKIMVGISQGWDVFLREIPTWRENFPLSFVNYETMFALVLVAVTWFFCGYFAELLEEIGPDRIQSATLQLVTYDTRINTSARQRLVGTFFWLGTFLVILTMLSRFFLRASLLTATFDPATIQLPPFAVGGASTLLYFMFSLALLSQTQFISLQMRWNTQRIPVNGQLARRWAGYSLLFFGLVILIVNLLPTSYGIQPFAMLGYFMYSIAGFVGDVFIKPGQGFATPKAPIMPQPRLPTPSSGPMFVLPPGWEVIQTILFWAIFLGVLFFALRQYMRQNQDLLEKLRRFAVFQYLLRFGAWLRSLLIRVKNTAQVVANFVRERTSLAIPRRDFGDGYINPRKLDPRHRVYFFYLAFIRRAGESGLPRSSAQTPEEYAATLQSALPESDVDIHALTEAFSAARYSPQPVEKEQSQQVEGIWARVRKALQGKRSIG